MAPCCPFCHSELIESAPDELDQSGETFLPAVRWSCRSETCCGMVDVILAIPGEVYRSRLQVTPS